MADPWEGAGPLEKFFWDWTPSLSQGLDDRPHPSSLNVWIQPLLMQACCEYVLFHYSYPLTLSNVGKPNWIWIPREHILAQKEKKSLLLLIYVLHKPRNKAF